MRSTAAAGRGRRGRTTPTARTRAVLVGGALAVLLLDTWGLFPASAQAGTGRPGPGAGAPSFTTPLATSVQVGGSTWATVAMGDLNQPLNTFWQLMFRPEGSSTWSDRVEATAVATNGGLAMATSASSLIVGVRPSDDLTFSPLISTTDSGRSWSNGLLDQGLAARPRSLAEGPAGTPSPSSRAMAGPKSSAAPTTSQPGSRSRRWTPSLRPRRAEHAAPAPSLLSGTYRAARWSG